MIKYNTALVIDGDPISNFVTAITLEKVKMTKEIKTSRSPQNSIDRIKEIERKNGEFPDLIILDLLNNEDELVDFLYYFNNLNSEIRGKIKLILLTTASAKGIERAERFQYPHILRPITEDKLLSIL